jgi:hypothetical protein
VGDGVVAVVGDVGDVLGVGVGDVPSSAVHAERVTRQCSAR